MLPNVAWAKSMQEPMLDQSGEIFRDTQVSDGAGGHKQTPVSQGTVACRVGILGNRRSDEDLRIVAERLGLTPAYVIRLPVGTNVRAKDTVVVSGRMFTVEYVPAYDWQTILAVLVREAIS